MYGCVGGRRSTRSKIHSVLPLMPLYDIVAIVKAAATRPAVSEVLRRAAVQVMDAGGVVTDVKSYGLRDLAYDIRKAGETHKQVRARARGRALLRLARQKLQRQMHRGRGAEPGVLAAAAAAACSPSHERSS